MAIKKDKKKESLKEQHEKNIEREDKTFFAKIGMIIGLAFTIVGVAVALIGGFAVEVGGAIAGAGIATSVVEGVTFLKLKAEDKKACKDLTEEYPDLGDKNIDGNAKLYSREALRELSEMNRFGRDDFYLDKLEKFERDDRNYDSMSTNNFIEKDEEKDL